MTRIDGGTLAPTKMQSLVHACTWLSEVFFAATVSHVFAENYDTLVAPHFVPQGGIDQVCHRFGLRMRLRCCGFLSVSRSFRWGENRLGVERRRSRIQVRRIHVSFNRIRLGRSCLERSICCCLEIVVDLRL